MTGILSRVFNQSLMLSLVSTSSGPWEGSSGPLGVPTNPVEVLLVIKEVLEDI